MGKYGINQLERNHSPIKVMMMLYSTVCMGIQIQKYNLHLVRRTKYLYNMYLALYLRSYINELLISPSK